MFCKRTWRFLYQRITRGWDDSELWSLDYSLAKLILPRLKLFAERHGSHPNDMSEKEWNDILNEMVFAMEFSASEARWDCNDKEIWDRVHAGLELFGKHYGNLWD